MQMFKNYSQNVHMKRSEVCLLSFRKKKINNLPTKTLLFLVYSQPTRFVTANYQVSNTCTTSEARNLVASQDVWILLLIIITSSGLLLCSIEKEKSFKHITAVKLCPYCCYLLLTSEILCNYLGHSNYSEQLVL